MFFKTGHCAFKQRTIFQNILTYHFMFQLINQTILSNRRAYGDLFARLMISDIEREKKLHAHWLNRTQDWKQLKIDDAVRNFM